MPARLRIWLRTTSAVVLVAFVVTLAVIAVQRARLRNPQVIAVGSDSETEGETVGVYHGFEFTESISGRTIFELSASRTLGKSSGWYEIEDVRLQFFNRGERGPLLTSDRASFNIQTRDARLKGAVHVELPGGGFVDTERGHFDSAGRRFLSDAPVIFAGPRAVGFARRAIYELANDVLILDEEVNLQTPEGSSLVTERLEFHRRDGRIVLPREVSIVGDGTALSAPRATVLLDEQGTRPRRLEMWDGVRIIRQGAADEGTLSAFAQRIVAERDGAGRWHTTATTDGPWVTLTMLDAPGVLERTITAWRMLGVSSEQGLESMRAEGQVCLRDVPVEGSPRWAEARQAQLWFRDGQPADAELTGDVRLHGDGLSARGESARLLDEQQRVILRGSSERTRRAEVIWDEAEISAEEIQLLQTAGRAEARGGVQGTMQDADLLGAGADVGRVPVRFAADRANATDDGESLQLSGGVRVWQGDRLLLAEEAVYRQQEGALDASGGVRTTLPAAQMNAAATAEGEVVVSSRSLTYRRDAGLAVYQGDVRYTDPQHVLTANRLEVVLGPGDEVERLEASGRVEIVDHATGRRVVGELANYDTAAGTVVVEGNPVRAVDARGNALSGAALTWYRASGRVTVSGSDDTPSETIYHPEEPPEP